MGVDIKCVRVTFAVDVSEPALVRNFRADVRIQSGLKRFTFEHSTRRFEMSPKNDSAVLEQYGWFNGDEEFWKGI